MKPGQIVESYKFWDVAALWASECLENELVIARAMAKGIIVDGLRFQSVDPRWLQAKLSLTGYPYVGYAAVPEKPLVLLRAEALEHLLSVVRQGAVPSRDVLTEEFVQRDDFKAWLSTTRQQLPSFWFTDAERNVEA